MQKNKTSTFKNSHLLHDLLLIGLSLSVGFVGSLVFFDTILLHNPLFRDAPEQHAAAENSVSEPSILIDSHKQNISSDGKLQLEIQKKKNTYASAGQKALSMLEFNLNVPENGRIEELIIHVGGFAKPYDISNMQLYQNKKLLGSAEVFDGKAIFQNLSFDLPKGTFEIKGEISDQAEIGDRIQIGFESADDIKVKTEDGDAIEVENVFPLWSDVVSVIGGRK